MSPAIRRYCFPSNSHTPEPALPGGAPPRERDDPPGDILASAYFPGEGRDLSPCAPLADLPVAEKKELELRRRLDGHLPIRGRQIARPSGTGAFRRESPFPGRDKYRPPLPRVLRRGKGQVERGRSADAGYGSRQAIGGTEGARLPFPPSGIASRLPPAESDFD